GVGEFEAIDTHPEKPDTQIITFKERNTAESFVYGPKDIPSVGKLAVSWYNAPSNSTKLAATTENGDVDMGGVTTAGDHGPEKGLAEVDYDVAEDDDRWD
ncbi:MAG: hypothetical protein Q9217_001313, partial [Psora testacea]